MKYIGLNRAYLLRNEATCSYIVRKNMFVNSNISNYQTIYTIPPFLGYWKSHTNLTHPGKYFRPSKVKIMRPTSPK